MKATIHPTLLAIAALAIASMPLAALADAAEAPEMPAEATFDANAWRDYWHSATRTELTSAVRALAEDAADSVVADGRASIARGSEAMAGSEQDRADSGTNQSAAIGRVVIRNPG